LSAQGEHRLCAGVPIIFTGGVACLLSHWPSMKGNKMLHYAAVFLVIALIGALLGFTGIAAGAVEIARILFFIFIILFFVSLFMGLLRRK
jgi:uncharacterized membrane protein YtjA (UPF0391 family)